MKILITVCVALAYVTLCKAQSSCMSALCCTSSASYCTPELYTVNDECRCDSDCSDTPPSNQLPCCYDKHEWCGMMKRVLERNEVAIQREYLSEVTREFNLEKREHNEKEELMDLLSQLLKRGGKK